MNILDIKIYGFGNIISKDFTFSHGVNTINCANEEEAETIRDFIVSMLYGLGGRSDGGFRKKYFPGTMIRFGGEMNIEVSGRTYYISQFFGLAKQNDEVKFIETPGSRSIPLGNKTIGEILFNLQEPAFKAAFNVDFGMANSGMLGYLTPELGLTHDEEKSFFAAEKRLSERLSEIKSNDNKDGELDRLVIQKMSKTNELTRLSEQDVKIASKKKQLESLKKDRKEVAGKSKKQLRKVLLAASCSTLLEKDKIQSNSQIVKSDAEQIELLENKKYYIENRDLKKEIKVPFIIFASFALLSVISLVLALFKVFSFTTFVIMLLVTIVFGIVLVLKKVDFDNRFTISNGGIKTNIYDEIKHIKRKLNDDVDALMESLGGKTYAEQETMWREAEEVLRDASEDERRNAVLKKNDDDKKLLEELNAQIQPLDDQISKIETEIDELSSNLSNAYTEATSALVGIDERIKDLGREYKVTTLAKDVYEQTKSNVLGKLMPKIFADATNVFKEAYGDKKCDFSISESGKVSVSTDSMNREALLSLMIAINKNLLVKESNFTLVTTREFDVSRIPVDLRQVINLTY